MKYRRMGLEVEAEQYRLDAGMEDGFELWSDVVTKGWIVTDFLVKIKRENGDTVCPYIAHRRGRTFIGKGDYIVMEEDGTKHVCEADKMGKRFQKVK